ncbi:MAG: type II toxin-antitoxin system RelE/ParE family toxin [Gammaproteobacteria bacterium]
MRIDPRAQDDLVRAADHYNSLAPGAGDRFLVAVYQLIDQIVVFPHAGLLIRPGVRQRLVPRFPYCLVYTTDPTDRVVVAVAHTSRLAEYWIERWEVREPAATYLLLAA